MTFTLLARCPKTGQVGIGIATYSISVGLYCNGLRGNTGATMSQAFVNQGNNPLALRLLAQGYTPEHVMDELKANDPNHEYRQIAVIDRLGRVAAYSGPKNRGWAGHQIGDGYVAMGNVLTGKKVIDAMAKAYEAAVELSFERRLLAAIEAGRDAGGQTGNDGTCPNGRPRVMVYGDYDHAELDLRVDLHDTAVEELRRAFEEYEHYRSLLQGARQEPEGCRPAIRLRRRARAEEAGGRAMTFSLIGRCARTGRLGLGITTFSLAVGGRCEGVVANVGVCKTQAFPNRTNDPLGIKLLAQGYLPARVMEMFAANDTEHGYRQIAIMDRDGRIAAHTGPGCRGWAGHKEAADCVAFGNGLVGPQVLDGMIAGFLDAVPTMRWNTG